MGNATELRFTGKLTRDERIYASIAPYVRRRFISYVKVVGLALLLASGFILATHGATIVSLAYICLIVGIALAFHAFQLLLGVLKILLQTEDQKDETTLVLTPETVTIEAKAGLVQIRVGQVSFRDDPRGVIGLSASKDVLFFLPNRVLTVDDRAQIDAMFNPASPRMAANVLRGAALLGALIFAVGLIILPWGSNPMWATDPISGCRVWNPSLTAIRWNGPCIDGKADGHGTLQVFENGKPVALYEGKFVAGYLRGRGIKTWDRTSPWYGDRYEGDIVDGEFSGHGVETWPNGSRYEGEWTHNWPNGFGTLSLPDGTVYSGQWVNGCFRQSVQDRIA